MQKKIKLLGSDDDEKEEAKEEVKEKTKTESPIANFFKSLKDSLINNLAANLKEGIREKVIRVEKKIFRNITSYCFFILGTIFVFLALVFLADHYLRFNFGWSFLIIGGLSLLLAVIFKWLAKNV